MQKQRDAVTGVSFREKAGSDVPRPAPGNTASRSLSESVRAFEETDDLTVKARLILQNPDFLNMALMLDPSATRELPRSAIRCLKRCTWNWTHDSSPRRALWKIPFP